MVNGLERVTLVWLLGLAGILTLTKDPSQIPLTLRMTDDSSEKQRFQGFVASHKYLVHQECLALIKAVLTTEPGSTSTSSAC